jgi:hypothetical protein
MSTEEPPKRRDACRHTDPGEFSPDLRQRDVGLPLDKAQDQRRMSLNAPGATVTAQRPRHHYPASRDRARQRIALEALTPKRAAAARQDAPAAIAATTRSRRSTDSAFDMPIALSPQGT